MNNTSFTCNNPGEVMPWCLCTPVECVLSLILTTVSNPFDQWVYHLFILLCHEYTRWLQKLLQLEKKVKDEFIAVYKFIDKLHYHYILGSDIAYFMEFHPSLVCDAYGVLGIEQVIASLSRIDVNGTSQLHKSIMRNVSVNVWKVLMRKIPAKQKVKLLKMKDIIGWTALHSAALKRTNAEVLRYLLETIDSEERVKLLCMKTSDGHTPLHIIAIWQESGERMRVLLETLNPEQRYIVLGIMVEPNVLTNRTINKKTSCLLWTATPMHIAANGTPNPEVIIAMLEYLDSDRRMALLSLKDNHKLTPLHVLMSRKDKNYEVTEALLDTLNHEQRFSLLSQSDDENLTPVHHAARYQESETVIRALMEPLDSEKRMTLMRAESCHHVTPLHLALFHNMNYKFVEAMLDTLGPEDRASLLSKECNHQVSPLHVAAIARQDEAVITALLGPLDSDRRMKLLSARDAAIDHCAPLHSVFYTNPTRECTKAWLEKLSSAQRVKLLCLTNNQRHTPVHIAAIRHENADVIKSAFEPLTTQQKMFLMDLDENRAKSPLQLAMEHNRNLHVSKALLEQVPRQRKIGTLMPQADGESKVVYADTEKHMAIMSDEAMFTKIEYLNLRSTSNKRLVHEFVCRKQFPQVLNFLSLPNRKLDVASCLVVFIAAKTGNVLADTGLIESISSHEHVSRIDKQYWELLTQYMETAAKGPLSKLLDYLACRIGKYVKVDP